MLTAMTILPRLCAVLVMCLALAACKDNDEPATEPMRGDRGLHPPTRDPGQHMPPRDAGHDSSDDDAGQDDAGRDDGGR